jgi:hypothetical protein
VDEKMSLEDDLDLDAQLVTSSIVEENSPGIIIQSEIQAETQKVP